MSAQIEGLVETILPGGDGIVRHNQTDIFISHVVAGDFIRFQPMQKRRGVLRGELLEVITPSKQRIAPPCSVAAVCGGCALQAMNQSAQADLKNTWVQDAFKHAITDATDIIPLQTQNFQFAGRRRVRWFIENGKLGFRKRLSHQIVSTSQCVALSQSLDALRQQLESLLTLLPEHVQSIQAIELDNGTHLILESEASLPLDIEAFDIPSVQWWWRKLNTPSIKPINRPVLPLFDAINLQPYANKNMNQQINIQIGPNDFVQGHQQGNQTLVNQILDWSAGSQRVVDFFSGCGNLSLPIAAAFGAEITGAELNSHSVAAANQNAKRLKLHANYQTIDLFGKFKIEPFVGADTLIIDPPRKGAKNICNRIAQLFPKQVIMVNCDSAAGSRDAKALSQAGFKLKALRPLDLFPYTGHVEVLSLWSI